MTEDEYTLIGGHPGLEVRRYAASIHKVAFDSANRAGLKREAEALRLMAGIYAPKLFSATRDEVVEEDIGDHRDPVDGEAFRHELTRLLWYLRARGLRHGDLTSRNLIIGDGDRVKAIDFQEAHPLTEKGPRKTPWSDSYLLMRTLRDWPDASGYADTPRVARRWMAVLEYLGRHKHKPEHWGPDAPQKTFLDLGCFEGAFPALAACEGFRAFGLDQGGFRTGEDSIATARQRWSGIGRPPVWFDHANIIDLDTFTYDYVMLFSTWIYLVRDYGRPRAEAKLAEIIRDCGTLFFETQIAGDGPGPEWHPSIAAVEVMLRDLGAKTVEALVTIPVTGRPAFRTVWAVKA